MPAHKTFKWRVTFRFPIYIIFPFLVPQFAMLALSPPSTSTRLSPAICHRVVLRLTHDQATDGARAESALINCQSLTCIFHNGMILGNYCVWSFIKHIVAANMYFGLSINASFTEKRQVCLEN